MKDLNSLLVMNDTTRISKYYFAKQIHVKAEVCEDWG